MQGGATARRHHFIPRCYLKQFARYTDKPKLFVIDLKGRKTFRSPPDNVAAERDFHRIDADGMEPDALENSFSLFESELSNSLTRIRVARSLKDEDDKLYLLNLLTLVAIKNPRHRENLRQFQEKVLTRMMELAVETPERWQSQVEQVKAAGKDPGFNIPYEQMREFVRGRQFKITMPVMAHLGMELGVFDEILPYLVERKWTILRAPPKATSFVTSDHPVCLMWSDPKDRGNFYGPGFGCTKTSVFFPICNEIGMVGTFEEPAREIDATPHQVAAFNGAMLAYTERQAFARDSDFLYMMHPGDRVRHGSELLNDARFANWGKARL